MIIGLLLLALNGAHGAPEADAPGSTVAPSADAPAPAPSSTADPCQAAPPDRGAPFEQELDRAKRLYRRGCHGWALEILQDLDLRRRLSDVPVDIAVEQRKYLGEVLLILGRRQEARRTFELLLVEHGDTQMGLLEHAPDAVALFETVRGELDRQRPDPDPPPAFQARKAVTYLPFGVAHFRAGDAGLGRRYAILEGLFFATAVTTAIAAPGGPAGISEQTGQELYRRALVFRIVNFAANAGFVTVYTVSQVQASRRWRRSRGVRAQVLLGPGGVGIRGSF